MATSTSENKLWHDTVTAWPDRNAFLFGKDFMSDCLFIVEENDEKVKIPGHKYILGGVCLDFYNLFYLLEGDTNEIPITDVSVSNFKVFLKYTYTGETDLTMENIHDVHKLVERFSIKCFKDYCETFLTKNLKKSNYIKIMDLSSTYGMENLNSKCMTFLNARDMLELPEFLDIKHETLSNVLKSNKSNVKEIEFFKGAIKWAERNCEKNGLIPNSKNKREALGISLMDIRFASMTIEEFTECTNETILTNIEELQVFKFFGSGGKSECRFSSQKRIPFITKLSFLNTSAPIIKHSGSMKEGFLIFEINKSLKIGGFGLQLNSSKSSKLPEKVIIQLFDYDTETEVLENETEIIITKNSKIHDLLFKETFTLEADITYRLDYNFPEVEDSFFNDLLIPEIYQKTDFDDNLKFVNYNQTDHSSIVYIGKVE